MNLQTRVELLDLHDTSLAALKRKVVATTVSVPDGHYPALKSVAGYRAGAFTCAPIEDTPGYWRIYNVQGLTIGAGTDRLRGITRALRALILTDVVLRSIMNADGSLAKTPFAVYHPLCLDLREAIESL